MKPILPVAVTPTVFRRFVRVLAFLVPAFLTSLTAAESWTATDIGNTGAAGSESSWSYLPPTFHTNASGADIYGTADSFRLMHTPASGDVVVVTQVQSMTNTHPWAKAGVMIRASLDPNAANVAMVLSPSQACSFQVRPSAGAATDVTLGPWVTPAYWVKLTRVGNTFTGYVSPNGTTWTQVGSRDVVLPAQVYAGFATSSHVAGTLTHVDFAAADVNGSSVAPTAPSNVTIGSPAPHSAVVTWTDNSTTEDGFRIYVWRQERHATYPELRGTVAANATSFTITDLSSESWYNVFVSASRGSAERTSPTIVFSTPQDSSQPPATPGLQYVRPSASGTLDIHWTETGGLDSGYETGFELERSSDGSAFTLIATLGENVGGYQDTGLTNGTTYSYRVRAVKGTLYSGYSNVMSAKPVDVPAAPTSLSVGNPTASSLQLMWTDNSSTEVRYEIERRTGSGLFQPLTSLPANTTSHTDTNLDPNRTYYYRVRAFGTMGSAYSNEAWETTTDGTTPPPSSWNGVDIGSPALAGSQSGLPPSFTMQAAGTDIQGTADSFRYMAQTARGDVTAIARVASLTNTNPWAKAGVMIRTSFLPGAQNVAMLLSPDQQSSFQVRTANDGPTEVTLGPWVTPPYWVKLTRAGGTVTGYVSPDGTTWTQVGSREMILPANLHIGFAATSHNASVRTTAIFDHAEATGSIPPPPEPTWTQQNWGGATGSFSPDSSGLVSSLTATSGDIYDASDSGVFVYQPWSGPGTFVTRVNAVGNSDGWAKGGLMFRASLDATAGNAFVALLPSAGAVFQSRPATPGALTTTVGHDWGAGPGSLLKLVRGGGTISAFFSVNNGTTWTSLGSVTDDLPATVYLGYAAASHNSSTATTATFADPE